MIYRQGDVLVMRLPDDATRGGDIRQPEPREDGRIVLAYGEVTGHAHAIAEPNATLWRTMPGADRLLIVDGDSPVVLRHEEHAPIELAPGTYLVRRQREYLPDGEDLFAGPGGSQGRSAFVRD